LRLDGNLGRATRLAKLTNALICPFYCRRIKGATFALHCLPPVELDFSLKGDDYLEQGVRRLDEVITPLIVANLDQWLMLDNFKVPAGAARKVI
jgi:KDO2-lipid IV(A) lauroyltransferase